MKSLIFIHVEGSLVDYTKLFNFEDCVVNFSITGNEFLFGKHLMKSNSHLNMEDFIFADKNDDVYLIGRRVCERDGIYLVDLSEISNEDIGQVMDKTTNYTNGLVASKKRWSVSFPVGHEFCIFREMGTDPVPCKHEKNVFKLCDVGLCPIKVDVE